MASDAQEWTLNPPAMGAWDQDHKNKHQCLAPYTLSNLDLRTSHLEEKGGRGFLYSFISSTSLTTNTRVLNVSTPWLENPVWGGPCASPGLSACPLPEPWAQTPRGGGGPPPPHTVDTRSITATTKARMLLAGPRAVGGATTGPWRFPEGGSQHTKPQRGHRRDREAAAVRSFTASTQPLATGLSLKRWDFPEGTCRGQLEAHRLRRQARALSLLKSP